MELAWVGLGWAATLALAVAPLDEPGAEQPIEVESAFLTAAAEVEVPAREAGVLTRVAVSEGGQVRRGELLAQLDEDPQRTTLARVETELEKARQIAANELPVEVARKIADVAANELRRAELSEEKLPGIVTETEFDRLRLTLDRAQLEMRQAEFEQQVAELDVRLLERDRELAEVAVDRRQITAPIDGVVAERQREEGEWIEPGQTLLRLVDLRQLRVEGFVPAELASLELVGLPVDVKVAWDGGEKSLRGEVVFVSPEVHPVTGKLRIWAKVDNPEGKLLPGLRTRATILPGPR